MTESRWWPSDNHLNGRILQDRVQRGRELSGSMAEEEVEPINAPVEVHDEVAGDVRPISNSSPSTCWTMRYSNRSVTTTIMPDHHRPSITAGTNGPEPGA